MSVKIIDNAVFDVVFKRAVDKLGRKLFNKSQQELLLSIEELHLNESSFMAYDQHDLSYIKEEDCERIQGYLRDSSFVQQHKDIVEKLMSMIFESSNIPSLDQFNKDLEKMMKFIFSSPKYVEEQIALRKENRDEPFVKFGENRKLFEQYEIIFDFEGVVENANTIKLDDGSKLLISMSCSLMEQNIGKPIFLSITVKRPNLFETDFLELDFFYKTEQQNTMLCLPEGGRSIAYIGATYPIPRYLSYDIESNVQFRNRHGNYSIFKFPLIEDGEMKIKFNPIPLPSAESNTSN